MANVIVVQHATSEGIALDTTIIDAQELDIRTVVAIGESIEVIELDLQEQLGLTVIGWEDVRMLYFKESSEIYFFPIAEGRNAIIAAAGMARVAPLMTEEQLSAFYDRYANYNL
jgi:hypothetical protein